MEMKKITLYILILFLITWFLPTHTSLAQGAIVCKSPTVPSSDGYSCVTPYVPLERLPNFPVEFDTSQTSSLGTYLNLMIKIIIGLAAVLAMIMIVMGGLEYMTSELISSKEEGKKRITGAILGLLLALGAYALLFTINPDLLNTKIAITSQTITVNIHDEAQTPDASGNYRAGNTTYHQGDAWNEQLAGAFPNNFPSGVTTNHPGSDCSTVGQQNCTSIRGLNLDLINATKTGCPACQLVITGGTESWAHGPDSLHKPGSPVVDLSATADLNTYITGNATFPNDGKPYPKNGVYYFAERSGGGSTGPHWHVSRSAGGASGSY